MNEFLISLGIWNFFGTVLLFFCFIQDFGKKVLNDWTKIFTKEFKLDYWSKFWMAWALGLNLFYAVVNIMSADAADIELKVVIILFDILAYITFLGLAIWGKRSGNCGSGIYSVIVIFSIWITWGIFTFMYK